MPQILKLECTWVTVGEIQGNDLNRDSHHYGRIGQVYEVLSLLRNWTKVPEILLDEVLNWS